MIRIVMSSDFLVSVKESPFKLYIHAVPVLPCARVWNNTIAQVSHFLLLY